MLYDQYPRDNQGEMLMSILNKICTITFFLLPLQLKSVYWCDIPISHRDFLLLTFNIKQIMKQLHLIIISAAAGIVLTAASFLVVNHLVNDDPIGDYLESISVYEKTLDYKTPDLQMVLAKGDVARIRLFNCDTTDWSNTEPYQDSYYDIYGWHIDVDHFYIDNFDCFKKYVATIERNSKAQKVKTKLSSPPKYDCDGDMAGMNNSWSTYSYNSRGFLSTVEFRGLEHGFKTKYYYNNYDEQIKSVTEKSVVELCVIITKSYSNYKYDDHGNWISRDVVKTEVSCYSEYADENPAPTTFTETREITYYSTK
jgi:hypothetical protein